ncbi:MAG: cupredoxin domain-containing protein [Candidatus Aenigmarchaeota archaeon]|nr:cupredoxin domain-containing protein [Candidatus Aenigmarchaeota archaeon]
MREKKLDIILYAFIALAIVLSIVDLSLISARSEKVREAARLAEKENQPARIELVKITDSSCKNCFDIDAVIESLKKTNVDVATERTLEFSSVEAKQLISQYKISKLPTVIASGEVNRSSALRSQDWQVKGNAVIYTAVSPPYVDASGNVRGLVSLTHIIDESCPKCANLTQVISFFKQNNVKFSSEKIIDYIDAKDMIEKFSIQKVPALIISKDILDYTAIEEVWDQLNATEKQGFYALHTTVPPYRNLATENVEGLVSVIYLEDKDCASCYDVQLNRQILERNFGVAIENETTVNTGSEYGKSLLKQYNISKVPVILVSPEVSAYTGFDRVWSQVGDVANNNWYIMRNPGVLGTYKDLSNGIVVNEIIVHGGEYEFQPAQIKVSKGETVRLTFVNAGAVEHNLVIDELSIKTKLLKPQASETVEFVADKTGTFSFYCSVGDHRNQGMEGKLSIS